MGKWLDNSFSFYASYHNNKINQYIHMVCIWPILWSAFVFLSYSSKFPLMQWSVNWLDIVAAGYFLYYAIIELPGIAGPFASALILFCWYSANLVHDSVADAWKPALILHVVAWLAQFYGHGVHEKRSPALLDNLPQAIFIAPLFVVLEVFFKFGYRQEFQKEVAVIVEKNIREFNEIDAKKK